MWHFQVKIPLKNKNYDHTWNFCFLTFFFSAQPEVSDKTSLTVTFLEIFFADVGLTNLKITEMCWGVADAQMSRNSVRRINPFAPNVLFLSPLSVFWCFQGLEKKCISNDCVNWTSKCVQDYFWSQIYRNGIISF